MATISEGMARLGADMDTYPFVWDNEQPVLEVLVPAFAMDVHNVTNGEFLHFLESGGYQRKEFWDEAAWRQRQDAAVPMPAHPVFWRQVDGRWYYHGMFDLLPLPLSWPVLVTYYEARAYARFVGKSLPREAEWHRALLGEQPLRRYPWGDALPDLTDGNFGFGSCWEPMPVGSFPQGKSVYGIHDLVGNGWEWTESPFAPFPGFQPSVCYPEYSADFFDDAHFVMKGGSWFTDVSLLRPSFRNWFYGHYPYMYATFRCVERP
jgi:formylglycine-generating enzyme required for sulfatase activity